MKKFIIVLAAIIIANLGCKKTIDTEQPCACSPIQYPSLYLVVKNTAGADLLNTTIAGSYTASQIQLYQMDANGNKKQIRFAVRPGFSYGTEKFIYNQLYSEEIATVALVPNTNLYLKLGDSAPLMLDLKVNATQRAIEKLMIDQKDAPLETGPVSNYVRSIFYLNL